ncbi:MAG: anhydro-N-acetylmuramic acid kinase [Oscillospiraceae bacterium]|nr:anhydro-N-acetylmuramic acid kinase [Oscillospiraceae bacterium]
MPYIIGLMSGTSLDGCDAALIEIPDTGIHGAVRQLAFITAPMPERLRRRVLDACSPDHSSSALLCSLNVELGRWFADAVKAVCAKARVQPGDVMCVGSHGQTIYHIPQDSGELLASTMQLGEPAVIAYDTGIPVVSSFRAMDMAAGGRGAPLVPYAEYLLYRADHPRALQNIGGIGNVTVLPADAELDDVFAFDTGPGNMIIDALVQRLFGMNYDDGGRIAASGTVNEPLLNEWMSIPFIDAPPPKATGRELFGARFVQDALAAHPGLCARDWIATATQFTAASIARNIRMHVMPRCPVRELVISGGGVHNATLRHGIQTLLPDLTVLTQEDLGWDSDAKEAVAFALLAYETMNGRPGNVPGATGASRQVVLGSVTGA